MKKLHKKIGVGVLSAALLAGVPMAGVSIIGKGQSGIPVADAYSLNQKLPFLREHELRKGDKRQAAENNLKIVFGASKIYDYMIYSINPGGKQENWIKQHGYFVNGEEFLGYLENNAISEGMNQFNVGGQIYRLQFYSNSHRYKKWFLYLDLWQNLGNQALKDYMDQIKL